MRLYIDNYIDTIGVNIMSKIEEIYKAVSEKKIKAEENIRANPLAYVAGAFIGGIAVSYLMTRRK